MNRKTARVEHWPALLALGLMILLAFVAVAAQAYEPLTEDQAIAYMIRDPRGAVADIIALDFIEHSAPDALMPERTFTRKGYDLVLTCRPPWIDFTVGKLAYRIELPEETVHGVFRPGTKQILIIGAVVLGAAAAGLAVGAALGAH